jgi:hypothetical protein
LPLLRRLEVTLPLALGLGLIGAFLVLLWRHREPLPSAQPLAPAGAPEAREISEVLEENLDELKRREEFQPQKEKPKPAGTGLQRWIIEPLPEGWNPEIARRIADFFEKIDFDPADPDSYLEASKALEPLEEYLASLGPDALPTLEAILNAETYFVNRRRLLQAIGNLGPESEAATFPLATYFSRRSGDERNLSEMNYVIKAMGALKNDSGYSAMVGFIGREDLPDSYRAGFISQLGEHPRRAESTALFSDMMVSSDESRVRNYSAQALGKVATPDLLPDLMSAYAREPYWPVKQTILGSIGKIGHASAIPFLEDVARSAEHPEVRLSAANALRRVAGVQANAIIGELAQTETNVSVRKRFITWSEGGR